MRGSVESSPQDGIKLIVEGALEDTIELKGSIPISATSQISYEAMAINDLALAATVEPARSAGAIRERIRIAGQKSNLIPSDSTMVCPTLSISNPLEGENNQGLYL